MSKPFVIETGAEPADIVLRQDDIVRRHATLPGLDRRQFRHAAAARLKSATVAPIHPN